MAAKRKDIVFVGVDFWSRLVFKHEPTGSYLCSVDRLHDESDDEETIAEYLKEVHQLYVKSPPRDPEGEPNGPVTLED